MSPSRAGRLCRIVLLVLAACGAVSTHAADPPEYVAGLELGTVRQQDSAGRPDLRGYRFGFVAINALFKGSFYGEWKESRRQEIVEGGLELAIPYHGLTKRIDVGPHVRLAVRERAEPPHRGTEGLLGVGFGVGVALSERVQLAVSVDRGFGFESGTRNSYSGNLRIMLWED